MSFYRDQAAIIIRLSETNEPVSGVVLSNLLNCGLKTLKKEIDNINYICMDNGCQIYSKTGTGYQLKITDPEIYEDFILDIRQHFYSNTYFRDDKSERAHYIVRQFLTSRHYYVNELADACSVSDSTINRDMKKVKEILARYKLVINNHTNQGIAVEGTEWHIRLAALEEYMIYQDFESVSYFNGDDFNRLFMDNGTFGNMIHDLLVSILRRRQYYVPFVTIDRLVNMIILTITRRKYADGLRENLEWFKSMPFSAETDIVQDVFSDLPGLTRIDLSEEEMYALAVFIRSCRVIKFHEFKTLDDSPFIEKAANGLIDFIDERIRIKSVNNEVLYKDLCCNLMQLFWRASYDIHIPPADIRQFLRDGMTNLDFCILSYLYLHEGHIIQVNFYDCASLYYVFAYLQKSRREATRKKVLVVSRYGFYAARALIYTIERLGVTNQIELKPVEYLRLGEENMSSVAYIATDIDQIRSEYYYKPVLDIHFFRDSRQVNEIMNQIRTGPDTSAKGLFAPDDLYYAKGVKNVDDIYRFIKDNILQEEDDKELFIRKLRAKDEIVSNRRVNRILLLNNIQSHINRSFIKIIILDNDIVTDTNVIRIVVIYNVAENEISAVSEMTEYISKIMHASQLIIEDSAEKDYETLRNILFG